ncbi:Rdx family domain-containing protein [Trichoderma gracile]
MASSAPPQPAAPVEQSPVTAPLPRITIQFCTQCKWMLRAAYYAQELLSTFSLSIGEVALQPSTGGTFIVTIYHHQPSPSPQSSTTAAASSSSPATAEAEEEPKIQSTVLWDRKTDGGFPETKDLKRRVRDVIEPGRNLGHVDRDHHRPSSIPSTPSTSTATTAAAAAAGTAAGTGAGAVANSASAATLSSADDVQRATQEAAATTAAGAPASSAASVGKQDAAAAAARQDEDLQKKASSGNIVCEDCT